jgi:hypothetical protein
VLTWDRLTDVVCDIVAQDGAGAVTHLRLADELTVETEAVRFLAPDIAVCLRTCIDREIGRIAAGMHVEGEWRALLVMGLTESIIVGRNYMTAPLSAGTGFVLGPGVISWIDAVITLLEQSGPADDEWLYRTYRLVTSTVIGSAYTFRARDGRLPARDEIEIGIARLLDGLPVSV